MKQPASYQPSTISHQPDSQQGPLLTAQSRRLLESKIQLQNPKCMERFEKDANPGVRGFLHRPATPCGDALVLTHSAGSNCQAPLLVAVATAFAEAGFAVLRCDLPFRQERPHGPPLPGGSARDREGLQNAVQALRRLELGDQSARPEGRCHSGRDAHAPSSDPPGSFRRVFLGGHSYGGRQATMLAASDRGIVDGLFLLSYPLHPPRKPSEPRTAHFAKLRTRALFVHGSRDPFGTLEEMESALKLIPAATSLLPIDGAGHDLKFGRVPRVNVPDTQGQRWQTVVEAFRIFVG